MGKGAHAGSPGGLVAPHQGHPHAHPVHKLKVENAILHPKVHQPRRRPAPVPLRCDPDLHAYPPASPACFMCPFGCTRRHASTPQETALRGGDNGPARRCDLVHFEAVRERCGGCSRTAGRGGWRPGRFGAPSRRKQTFVHVALSGSSTPQYNSFAARKPAPASPAFTSFICWRTTVPSRPGRWIRDRARLRSRHGQATGLRFTCSLPNIFGRRLSRSRTGSIANPGSPS